jgi:hypothetical protein
MKKISLIVITSYLLFYLIACGNVNTQYEAHKKIDSIEINKKSPNVYDTIDFILEEILVSYIPENSNYGDISYVVEDTMVIGKNTVVNMTISENVDIDEILYEIETFTEENIHSEHIRIAPIMRAKLIDPTSENFTIVPISTEEQLIENDKFTTWEWYVIALKEGNNSLKLTVDIIYDGVSKNVEVYQDFIYVYSDKTVWNNISDFFVENWKWLLSTLLIPFSIYIYKIRKNKKKE